MSHTQSRTDRLSLVKQSTRNKKIQGMNKVETLKNRLRQRLGLNYVAYMGNPDFNETTLERYISLGSVLIT